MDIEKLVEETNNLVEKISKEHNNFVFERVNYDEILDDESADMLKEHEKAVLVSKQIENERQEESKTVMSLSEEEQIKRAISEVQNVNKIANTRGQKTVFVDNGEV